MQIDVEPVSMIGESSRFEGRFLVRGSMRIDGCFEGGARMVDQLAVGAKGRVRTNITASSVVVEGIVIGNIEASRRVLLLSTARGLGDRKTPELSIQEGGGLEGRCTIGRARTGGAREHIESLYAGAAEQP